MIINYNIEKINAALEDFYKATNININLLKDDFSFVGGRSLCKNSRYCLCVQNMSAGKEACHHSDVELLEKCRETKKPQIHICHAGLIDAVAPILYNDVIIGYIIFGEMRSNTDFSEIKNHLSSLGLHSAEMKKYYYEIPLFDSDRIKSVSNIIIMLIKYLLLENMLKPNFDDRIQRVITYINENLTEKLTIQEISKNANISKTILYKRFHDAFNCTISEYINEKRIERSCEFLIKTNLSVEDIAHKAGFSSTSYYVKIFKRLKGITPLKYRNFQDN